MGVEVRLWKLITQTRASMDVVDAESSCSQQKNTHSTDNSGALKRSKTTDHNYRTNCGGSENSRKRILNSHTVNNNTSDNDNANANARQTESEYDSCSD